MPDKKIFGDFLKNFWSKMSKVTKIGSDKTDRRRFENDIVYIICIGGKECDKKLKKIEKRHLTNGERCGIMSELSARRAVAEDRLRK